MNESQKPGRKKLFIKTFGCQMNVYDSARMADALDGEGYVPAATPEGADLVILNTCHIREKAAEKVFSELGRLRALKEARAKDSARMLIGVAGCVAQAQGEHIMQRAPVVDLLFGPQAYHLLPELEKRARRGERVIEMNFPAQDKFNQLPDINIAAKNPPVTAFLAIQEGCDKFCTFCVVPYTRGAEYSRPVARIIDEARKLAAKGAREITLLGQNVNAWHGEGEGGTWGLGRLLHALGEIEGLERLRYTTSHPRDMDDELLEAHKNLPQLMPYLHLPVQSGSDRILKAMNRRHTAAEYLRIIDKIRKYRPDIAMASDFIVGFPGETDADFADTLKLVREVNYAQAYSFKYSERPGTPAAEREDQVPEELRTARLAELQDVLNSQQGAFNAARIGKTMDILFDRPGRQDGQIAGRSPYMQAVHVQGPSELMGGFASVTISSAGVKSLGGELVSKAEGARA